MRAQQGVVAVEGPKFGVHANGAHTRVRVLRCSLRQHHAGAVTWDDHCHPHSAGQGRVRGTTGGQGGVITPVLGGGSGLNCNGPCGRTTLARNRHSPAVPSHVGVTRVATCPCFWLWELHHRAPRCLARHTCTVMWRACLVPPRSAPRPSPPRAEHTWLAVAPRAATPLLRG